MNCGAVMGCTTTAKDDDIMHLGLALPDERRAAPR
uniref:Uncharacterized protein n=1 Tax=Arundo donax TaxID=35708 RepID=A0A0A9BJY6_ARUDO